MLACEQVGFEGGMYLETLATVVKRNSLALTQEAGEAGTQQQQQQQQQMGDAHSASGAHAADGVAEGIAGAASPQAAESNPDVQNQPGVPCAWGMSLSTVFEVGGVLKRRLQAARAWLLLHLNLTDQHFIHRNNGLHIYIMWSRCSYYGTCAAV